MKNEAKNNAYTLTVGAPLLRAGLSISTVTSERYAASAAVKLLAIVKQINAGAPSTTSEST
jgi:hypothetical protein